MHYFKFYLACLFLISSLCFSRDIMTTNEKPVVFYRDGKQIVGMLHLPQTVQEKKPAIMLLHGFTGNKPESHLLFTKMARKLTDAGFVCLRFDFLGSGDSQGEFEDMTILTELEDAKIALDFLLQQAEVDSSRIGVLGLSLGGCVAALLAGESASIKSLILLSAVAKPEENLIKLTDRLPKKYHEKNDWYLDNNGFAIGSKFFDVLPEVKPLDAIQSFTGAAFIIHGTNDQAVPISAARDYFDILKKRDNCTTDLFFVEKADHVFSSIHLTETVNSHIVEWFKQTLK